MLTLARLALLITVRKLADTAVGIDTPSEKKIIALRPGRPPIAATIDKRPSVVARPFSVCSIRSKPSAARSETPFKALSKAREAMLPMLWLVAAFASACESCWVSELFRSNISVIWDWLATPGEEALEPALSIAGLMSF